MHRPGVHLAALLHLGLGAALVADTLMQGWMSTQPLLGTVAAVLVALVAGIGLGVALRHHPLLRLLAIIGVPGLALAAHFAAWPLLGQLPAPATAPGVVLLALGLFLVVVAERRRREVRITLDNDLLTVFVRRYRLIHELPLDAVRDMTASRTFWGRMWGYGDFLAKVRKGTMKDRVTKPVVGEEPPEGATRGNGWDEEERFHLVSAHPYKSVRRALERRILLARMSPKEREEAELADRLSKDLDVLGST